MKIAIRICFVAVAVLAMTASGALGATIIRDNFDSYAAGVVIPPGNGWVGWGGDTANGIVTAGPANSEPNSLAVVGGAGTDQVIEFGYEPKTGVWDFSTMTYVPAANKAGETYFNLMNKFDDPGGVYHWSLVGIHWMLDSGHANADLVYNDGDATIKLPIQYDQWVEVSAHIDLTNDTCETFYGGVSLGTTAWSKSDQPVHGIDAMDIYPISADASVMYYDDISLVSQPIADLNEDGKVDVADVNLLTDEGNLPVGMAVPPTDIKFDLTGDYRVDTADLDMWLAEAAKSNGYESPYLRGDANLDGDVDVWAMDGSGDAQVLTSNLGSMIGATWSDGDFNGDGDIDVWAFDGSGDAQALTSNLGATNDATAGTAAAIYNAATGELSFDVGSGIAVVGIQADGLVHEAVKTDSALGAPAQNGGGILAYFNASGLPSAMAQVGLVLPTGLAAEEIGFSYTPIGGDSTVVPVTVIVPEPGTIAMLVTALIGIYWMRKRAVLLR